MKVSNNTISNPTNTSSAKPAQSQQVGAIKGAKVAAAATPKDRPVARMASAQPMLRSGSTGPQVKQMQQQLKTVGFNPGAADGIFGPKTQAALKAFQHSHGLSADGVFGPKSNAALDRAAQSHAHANAPARPTSSQSVAASSSSLPTGVLREGSRGPAVAQLQHALAGKGFNPGPADGVFGPRTESALRSFQSSRGIPADGVYGPQTRAAFSRGPVAGGGHTGGPAPTGNNGSISYNGHTVSDPILRQKLERIADFFGRHITVTSGDRDYVPPGGSPTSLHLAHRAVDLHVDGLSDTYVFSKLKSSGILSGGYEVIHHGPYTITGGPHVHIGRYGDGRSSQFKVEGLTPGGRGVYTLV